MMDKQWTVINEDLLENISKQAKEATRQRKNYNFHSVYSDPINRMLNAFEPGTYCQPHKHESPDKREVFIALKGKVGIIFFNDNGRIIGSEIISPLSKCYAVEIPAGVWHTAVCMEAGSIVYEIKDGPYAPMDDKNMATWAPAEGESQCEAYLEEIILKANFDE